MIKMLMKVISIFITWVGALVALWKDANEGLLRGMWPFTRGIIVVFVCTRKRTQPFPLSVLEL
jgi:hypothetical protein